MEGSIFIDKTARWNQDGIKKLFLIPFLANTATWNQDGIKKLQILNSCSLAKPPLGTKKEASILFDKTADRKLPGIKILPVGLP